MSSEKTQMVDLLGSGKKKSLIIKNFSKDGFLIDNKLHNYSILIGSENIQIWKIDAQISNKSFDFIKTLKIYPELLLIGVGDTISSPYLDIRSKMSELSIAVEIMTTPSACRTWNVLISEGRQAFACLKL
tara:strand:- start:834 stop:1223 length:390 start_codon:yes stop_codon:yes gene_type:complete